MTANLIVAIYKEFALFIRTNDKCINHMLQTIEEYKMNENDAEQYVREQAQDDAYTAAFN